MSRIKGFFKGFLGNSAVDALFRLLIVVSLALGALASLRAQQLAECQLQYNDYFNQRARALTDAAEQERMAERRADDAFTAFMASYQTNTPQSERSELFFQLGEALAGQQQERLEADRARAAHPVPPPPSAICK